MADFKTYEEARAFAQQRANASGISQGLEKDARSQKACACGGGSNEKPT